MFPHIPPRKSILLPSPAPASEYHLILSPPVWTKCVLLLRGRIFPHMLQRSARDFSVRIGSLRGDREMSLVQIWENRPLLPTWETDDLFIVEIREERFSLWNKQLTLRNCCLHREIRR